MIVAVSGMRLKAEFIANGNKGKAFHTGLSPLAPASCRKQLKILTCFDCPLPDCEADTNGELAERKPKNVS